jgi:hypothetical protein
MVNKYKGEIPCVLIGLKELERLKEENNRLREALKTCIPFTAHTHKKLNVCEFCLERNHTKDCEYVKLTESEGT